MKTPFPAPIALLTAFIFTTSLFAQNASERNSLLPEIDPQDIEIRSEFRARFPGLRRQPILGFNPRPRVFRIDPNRMPFMESNEQVVANLPVSQLSGPQPPELPEIEYPNRNNGYLFGGFGSYTSPEVVGFYAAELNRRQVLTASVDYRSTDGHLDNQESSFRFFDGALSLNSRTECGLIITTKAGLQSDFNYLPGVIGATSANDTPRKNYLGVNGGVELRKYQNSLEYWEGKLNVRLMAIDVDPEAARQDNLITGLNGEVNEQMVQAAFAKHWAGNRLFETFSAYADLNGGAYEFTNSGSNTLLDLKTGLKYQRMLETGTEVRADAGIQFIDDGIDGNIYVAPELNIRQNFREKLLIDATVFGKPELTRMSEHHRLNRFLDFNSDLKQSYALGAKGRVSMNLLQGFQVFGGLDYRFINNYNFYLNNLATGPTLAINQTFYTIQNGDASIFKLYGGIVQEFKPNVFWMSVEAYARSPRLSGGGDIPFEERLGLSGSISFRPADRILLESWVDYIGEREDPLSPNDLSGFLLVNFRAEARIVDNFGAYIKSLNLLNSDYQLWQGYTERPFQFFVGLTYRF
jgi:hypothetical protein